MTAQELTLRTVILHNDAPDASGISAQRLLNDLGHEVATTASADQAMELLQGDGTDLLVIDADRAGQTEFVSRLGSLPADQQPRRIAIFTDANDESLASAVQRLSRARVHVLLKPLHMHGLLGILRNIEGKA